MFDQGFDHRGADASALPFREQLDLGQINLLSALLNRQDTDVDTPNLEDLTSRRIEVLVEVRRLLIIIPAQEQVRRLVR